MSDNTVDGSATDRSALARWEAEGGRPAREVESSDVLVTTESTVTALDLERAARRRR